MKDQGDRVQKWVERIFRLRFRLASVKRREGRKEEWIGRASDYSAAGAVAVPRAKPAC